MALETLLISQIEAARFYNVSPDDLAQLQLAQLHELGEIRVGDRVGEAYRAYCGPMQLIGKGGIRMAREDFSIEAKRTVGELAAEMNAKLAARGQSEYRGAKGFINLDSRTMSYEERASAIEQYAKLMHEAGLAGGLRDVPAGDVGTNGLADVYATAYRELNPADPYWQASITGKSTELGGLNFRTAATGWGGYISQRTLLQEMIEHADDQVDVTIQGFGNVGSWHAHFASEDPHMRVRAISDAGGTLYSNDPVGLAITENIVREIGDNPKFNGSKIHALAERLRKEGYSVEQTDDPGHILHIETDHLVLAAMGNVLNPDNMRHLRVRQAIIEDANGPTQPLAHEYLVGQGVTIIPDFIANGGGVDCSITERQTNIAIADRVMAEPPSDTEVKKLLANSTEQLVRQMFEMSERVQEELALPHLDLRIGSAALSMGRLLAANGMSLRSEAAELIQV